MPISQWTYVHGSNGEASSLKPSFGKYPGSGSCGENKVFI